jgi:penicillin-binding protein 2
VRTVAAATSTPTDATRAVAAEQVARSFLTAWSGRHYDDMYDVLSPGARTAITATAFVNRYSGIASVVAISSVVPQLIATGVDGNRALVTFTVAMSTTSVGTVNLTNTMPLHFDGSRWSIGWTPDLIFPGLGDNYRVHVYAHPARRGAIVDRLGRPLALAGDVLQVGVVPQYISDEKALLDFLSSWLHMPAKQIRAMYHVAWAVKNPSYFVPITTVTSLQWNAIPPDKQRALRNNGLDVQTGITRRLYPQGTLASQLLGYVLPGSSHGSTGLEYWADSYLAGHDGAQLAIATAPDFAYIVSTIKERRVQDGATLHLTLDSTLQDAAEKALKGKVGAVVALRPSDGAVLAMASAPGFDPNGFATGLSSAQYEALLNSPHQPFLNRAVEGQYPAGSVFKIVTMGAALEKQGFTPATTRFCAGIWTGLGAAYAKRDWLPQGHGWISLHEALVQSCDIYFYQVGLEMDQKDHNLLPDYARSWGFGAPTGIVGLSEGSGVIPDPQWTQKTLGRAWVPGNAVDMAIGQGYVEVTPLQVAQMLAALGDNGVMHRPYLVQRITAADGTVLQDTKPVVSRVLPLSAAHLQDILSAMRGVTSEAYGTAADKFVGFNWPVAGKTGTAQAPTGNPHAWFVALAPADHPTIALAVLVEHGGEGSAVAAPLARQILQTYFTQHAAPAGTSTGGPQQLPVP